MEKYLNNLIIEFNMKKAGRPIQSDIRQNVIDILGYIGKGYGYEIFKIYMGVFPKCTIEVIYYHMKKGVTLDEFKIHKVKQEKGDFSWGPLVEKTYYSLGTKAAPRKNKRVEEYLKKAKRK